MKDIIIETAYAASKAASRVQEASDATQGVESFIFETLKQATKWGFALALIIISLILAKIVKASVTRIIASRYDDLHRDFITFMGRIAYMVTMSIGFLISFNTIGIDITTILGGLMVGIGLAMRDVLANFAAGAVILFSRQISSGQTVKMEGEFVGSIEDIQSRATIVRGFDGTMTIVPNMKFLTNTITNFSTNDFRRHEILVGISYDDDLVRAYNVIAESLKKHTELVPELPPQILVTNFGDSSIEFTIRFWLESKAPFPGITSKIMMYLKRDFDEAGITIPWPIRTLKIDKNDPALLETMRNLGTNLGSVTQ